MQLVINNISLQNDNKYICLNTKENDYISNFTSRPNDYNLVYSSLCV